MDIGPIEEQQPRPEAPAARPRETAPADSNRSATRGWLIAALLILFGMNAFVLYVTNSRITDLEVRVADLSNSGDSKAKTAQATAPGRTTAPDPGKVYTINTEGAPSRGPASAPITIVEISDFQCPYCARVRPTLDKVREVYGDKVQIVWKHLPIEQIHQNAMGAAIAAEAAKKQGKFWEFHDKLFTNQGQLAAEDLRRYAQELKLNLSKFDADIADPATKQRVTNDIEEAKALGIGGTPGFFINGRFLNGAQPFEVFSGMINGELTRLNLPVPQTPQTPAKQ